MSDLAEAIDDVDELLAYANDYFRDKWGLDEKAERIKAHLRRVLEGEQVQWCEEHGTVRGFCPLLEHDTCSIVPKLLIDPPESPVRGPTKPAGFVE